MLSQPFLFIDLSTAPFHSYILPPVVWCISLFLLLGDQFSPYLPHDVLQGFFYLRCLRGRSLGSSCNLPKNVCLFQAFRKLGHSAKKNGGAKKGGRLGCTSLLCFGAPFRSAFQLTERLEESKRPKRVSA